MTNKSNSGKSKEGRFDWINKPIVLWFLSSVVIGLIAFSFRNYSACRADIANDEDELRRNAFELNQRWAELDNDLRKWPSGSIEQLEIVKRYLDRSAYFYSAETRNKDAKDLGNAIERVVRKWYPDWSTVEATNRYRTSVERMTPMGPAPPEQLEEGQRLAGIISNSWDLVSRYRGLDEAAQRWASYPYGDSRAQPRYLEFAKMETTMSASGYGFAVLLFPDRDKPFLSSNVCVVKAIWPF
ncbi:MAG: hypothetical protein E5X48_31070 [Mesorhizobium sp.]|uniref:hypothetical protein n=1 Tax=Mesorhizobium sp. TaxID=1871066 RepID=UPI001225F229|nr:hypothetical protein [Mesorhizobium sp.]TIQ28751.1 MAG: hypothetical protein E5X48_31070 [Mesorhizobium sp.]